jgi:hypothetical protein
MITDDARCTCEIKSRTAMTKVAFHRKAVLASRLDLNLCTVSLNLRKKLVKFYIWSIMLHGAEAWTLESFEMWCWRRMEKISWPDYVRNE